MAVRADDTCANALGRRTLVGGGVAVETLETRKYEFHIRCVYCLINITINNNN